jgi:hypothetical protein
MNSTIDITPPVAAATAARPNRPLDSKPHAPASAAKILRAEHLGMCFGVRDAIALAESAARQQPLTILGELVHNESVLADLRRRGIRLETDPAQVPPRSGPLRR